MKNVKSDKRGEMAAAGPRTKMGQLEDILLPGSGLCLDVGCGEGVHRKQIEAAGYKWVGLDIREFKQTTLRGDALNLPFVDEQFSAVVLWQTLEHLIKPWIALPEICRVLHRDGRVFGSASFLEPYHDFSYFGFSEYGLKSLLNDSGFDGVEIIPGISCFPLIAWTLFKRMTNGSLKDLAFHGAGMGVKFFNLLYPWLHKLYFLNSSSIPDLHSSYWLNQAPSEFAGHLFFRASKL